jgi:hypothetical protein
MKIEIHEFFIKGLTLSDTSTDSYYWLVNTHATDLRADINDSRSIQKLGESLFSQFVVDSDRCFSRRLVPIIDSIYLKIVTCFVSCPAGTSWRVSNLLLLWFSAIYTRWEMNLIDLFFLMQLKIMFVLMWTNLQNTNYK